jgi:hypothetical protein
MKNALIVKKNEDGKWVTFKSDTKRPINLFRTQSEAIAEARRKNHDGLTVVVHGVDGKIVKVLRRRKRPDSSIIREARVRHKRTNQDVNIAIAKALNFANW